MWGAVSDERTDPSLTIAAGPRHRSHSRVRVPWDSRPYLTVSDSRLPFLSPPTTRRAMVEIFDPASTRDSLPILKSKSKTLNYSCFNCAPYNPFALTEQKTHFQTTSIVACAFVAARTCLTSRCLVMILVYLLIKWSLHSNGSTQSNNKYLLLCIIPRHVTAP
jgi:hypothetical protein